MPYAYIGLGSNLENRSENLQRAVDFLSEKVALVDVSSTYDSAPLYEENQPRFLNAVLKIYTEKPHREVLEICQNVEAKMGKEKKSKNGPRLIDLDLLLYAGETVRESGLNLPHPEMQKRRFVLEPLCEIAPDLLHPVLNKPIHELLAALRDQDVRKEGELTLFRPQARIFTQIDEAEQEVATAGVEDLYSIKTMAQKCITKTVLLRAVRATMANILKQEMLSLGGDAAVHRDCISNKVDHSDVLLVGNLKQMRQLVSKLRVQVAESGQIAKAVEKAIR